MKTKENLQLTPSLKYPPVCLTVPSGPALVKASDVETDGRLKGNVLTLVMWQ